MSWHLYMGPERAHDGHLYFQWAVLQERKPELGRSLVCFHSKWQQGCSLVRDVTSSLTLLPVTKQTKQTWKMDQVKSDQGLVFVVHSARVCRNSQGLRWVVSLNVWQPVTETNLISHFKDCTWI